MNWSEPEVVDVPPAVATVTSTVEADSAGEETVSDVAELRVTPVPATVPNFTAVTPVKLVPVTVTVVPPEVGPDEGLTTVTVGAATYVYLSLMDVADVPPAALTVTSTVPVPVGALAVICVALFTMKVVAGFEPKATALTAVKLVPVIVTEVPPAVGPDEGLTAVTVVPPT